jgi:hypothetical protein
MFGDRFDVIDDPLISDSPTFCAMPRPRHEARGTDRAQLIEEVIAVIIDVPGEAEGMSPAQAAATIRLTA